MTPAARLSAAIEVMKTIDGQRVPAAKALKEWGAAHRFAVGVFGELVALAHADEQHALGRDARELAQQQRRARLSRQVAERLLQRAARGLIDALRGRRELALGVHAKHHAAAFGALGRERLYAKFHSESIA